MTHVGKKVHFDPSNDHLLPKEKTKETQNPGVTGPAGKAETAAGEAIPNYGTMKTKPSVIHSAQKPQGSSLKFSVKKFLADVKASIKDFMNSLGHMSPKEKTLSLNALMAHIKEELQPEKLAEEKKAHVDFKENLTKEHARLEEKGILAKTPQEKEFVLENFKPEISDEEQENIDAFYGEVPAKTEEEKTHRKEQHRLAEDTHGKKEFISGTKHKDIGKTKVEPEEQELEMMDTISARKKAQIDETRGRMTKVHEELKSKGSKMDQIAQKKEAIRKEEADDIADIVAGDTGEKRKALGKLGEKFPALANLQLDRKLQSKDIHEFDKKLSADVSLETELKGEPLTARETVNLAIKVLTKMRDEKKVMSEAKEEARKGDVDVIPSIATTTAQAWKVFDGIIANAKDLAAKGSKLVGEGLETLSYLE